jgi:hypothetical protein
MKRLLGRRRNGPGPTGRAIHRDVYNVGTAIDGLEMNDATQTCVDPEPGTPEVEAQHDVTYIYGECVGGSKLPPLEVQSTPIGEKHAGLYNDGLLGQYPYEKTTIKGVPAASFDAGAALEIYTGTTTITIYGDEAGLVTRAAGRLRPAREPDVPAPGKVLNALSAAADAVPVPDALPEPVIDPF